MKAKPTEWYFRNQGAHHHPKSLPDVNAAIYHSIFLQAGDSLTFLNMKLAQQPILEERQSSLLST
jgi:hypothetical protein